MWKLMLIVFASVSLMACGKVCVGWDPEATGRECARTTMLCVPMMIGKTMTQSCTYTCAEWKPCSKCVFKMDDDDPGLPAEIDRPPDACE